MTNKKKYGIILSVPTRNKTKYAGMAELADALDSGSSEVTFVQVQVLLPAPTKKRASALFFVGMENKLAESAYALA